MHAWKLWPLSSVRPPPKGSLANNGSEMTIPKGGRDEKEATSTSHGRVSHEGERAEPLDGQSSERYLQPGDRWTMDDEMTIILTVN